MTRLTTEKKTKLSANYCGKKHKSYDHAKNAKSQQDITIHYTIRSSVVA